MFLSFLYYLITLVLQPLAPLYLRARMRRNKEDPARLMERMGFAQMARPEGALIWIHGASVGEGMTILPLARALQERGCIVLVTTGTYASAQLISARLPKGVIHQYMPMDFPQYVTRFLNYWHPDLILFAESELWPNMVQGISARDIPFILVNARFSARSYRRWRYLAPLIRMMLKRVTLCLAQTKEDAARFTSLGAPSVEVTGNMKFDLPAPVVDEGALSELRKMTQGRLIWLAASTHPGEEMRAIEVHRMLSREFPHLLTMIMPRHDRRGAAIAQQIEVAGFVCARRSQGDPITKDTEIYLVDTMGEMGVFCTCAHAVWIGYSWELPGGGHNPIEPAKLHVPFFHGPYIQNFQEIYDVLTKEGATQLVVDPADLTKKLSALFHDPTSYQEMASRAAALVSTLGGAMARILAAIEPYLLRRGVL